MTAVHGFKDENLRPYGYNLAAFLNDEKMVQQAYGTAEPLYAAAAGAKVDTDARAAIINRITTIQIGAHLCDPLVDGFQLCPRVAFALLLRGGAGGEKPVPIDTEAEERRLRTLLSARNRAEQRLEADIAACQAG